MQQDTRCKITKPYELNSPKWKIKVTGKVNQGYKDTKKLLKSKNGSTDKSQQCFKKKKR